jgi:NADPH:quinone reductase
VAEGNAKVQATGVVDEVGEGTRQSVGDDVMAMTLPRSPLGGGYAERVIVPTESATAMPAGSGYAEACTLPMNGMTAQLSLDRLALSPGETLMVTGAAGAYGGYMVQLGSRHEGQRVGKAGQFLSALAAGLGDGGHRAVWLPVGPQ